MRGKAREAITALVLFVVLGFYSVTIGWRGVLLILDGRPAPVLLGVGVVLVPLVALFAIWRLILFARDGSTMMTHLGSDPAVEPRDEQWRAHLAEAESHRQRKDRAGEQAAYREAVRAWRVSRG